ncbi:PAS domain S-box protein [Candidatus Gracilibacteria bacterium]|nr:PAS domain S-box protein [Candidatus Gracilibacteria bacterium]
MSDLWFIVLVLVAVIVPQAIALVLLRRAQARHRSPPPEELFHALFAPSSLAAALITLEGRVLHSNAALHRLIGQKAAMLQQRAVATLFDAEYQATINSWLATLQQERVCARLEIPSPSRAGTRSWLQLSADLVYDVAGTPHSVLLLAEDIGARKAAEQQLRSLVQQQNLVLHSMPDPFWFKDLDGRYVFWSKAFLAFHGLSDEHICGKTAHDIFPAERAADLGASDAKVMATRQPIRKEVMITVPLSGEQRWVDTAKALVYADDGQPIGVLGIIHDMTARKQAEDGLRHSRTQLELALWGADLGLWDWNIPGTHIETNAQLAHLLGLAESELSPVVEIWNTHTHPDDLPANQAAFAAAFAGQAEGIDIEFVHAIPRKDGAGSPPVAASSSVMRWATQCVWSASPATSPTGTPLKSSCKRAKPCCVAGATICPRATFIRSNTAPMASRVIVIGAAVLRLPPAGAQKMPTQTQTGSLSNCCLKIIRASSVGRPRSTIIHACLNLRAGRSILRASIAGCMCARRQKLSAMGVCSFTVLRSISPRASWPKQRSNNGCATLPCCTRSPRHLPVGLICPKALYRRLRCCAIRLVPVWWPCGTTNLPGTGCVRGHHTQMGRPRSRCVSRRSSCRYRCSIVPRRLCLRWPRIIPLLDGPAGPPGSTLLVPLRARNTLVGLLCIARITATEQFTSDAIALAQTVAGVLASALDNAHLFTQARTAAAEQERRRLARELHDSVSQALFAASRIAETLPQLWELDPDEGREALHNLHRFTTGALAEMRALLVELRPRTLAETALHETLAVLAPTARAHGVGDVQLALVPAPQLPPDVQVALYRIAQEALNNVIKHAQARSITVQLNVSPKHMPGERWQGTVELVVEDDGRGFTTAMGQARSSG